MRKRLLSFLLAAVLIVTMIPITVSAAEPHTHDFKGAYVEYDATNCKWAKQCDCGAYDTEHALTGIYHPGQRIELIYNGKPQNGFVVDDEKYTINNGTQTDAGTYTAVIKLKDGYIWNDGKTEDYICDWYIYQARITSATALSQEYTGEELVPEIIVKAGELTVPEDSYYIRNWSSEEMIKPGGYIGRVYGKGNYCDSTEVFFNIIGDYFYVSFDLNGGTDGPEGQVVIGGEKAIEPEEPSCEGFTFSGWYTDIDCTDGNEYDFESIVNGDYVLYAKWVKNSEPKPVEAYYAPLVADLKANEEGVIEWKAGDSLPLEAVKLLVEKPELSLEFTFTYENGEHTIFIPAGAFEQYYDVDIPWYGPAWLLQYFEKKSVVEYIVKKDDTINNIAKAYNTTAEEILKLNPNIKNPNLIYPGNKLNVPAK